MSKPAFKLPERTSDRHVDDWVAGEEAVKPKVKPTRLTIDLDPELHARFKSTTALIREGLPGHARGVPGQLRNMFSSRASEVLTCTLTFAWYLASLLTGGT